MLAEIKYLCANITTSAEFKKITWKCNYWGDFMTSVECVQNQGFMIKFGMEVKGSESSPKLLALTSPLSAMYFGKLVQQWWYGKGPL